ncbi:hotdog fold thioesterase [Reinekea marinisedimentorum]|uniref:Uncharacterized protein (TIGR00369 family) n=1 Tax=Reinekea marinisedimentorum TaxID=230495 RepID=A0A4V2UJE0_9GAMM|nr:hotdog fold thioesterase [Reinekea marinisedimentorum]TCS39730.1 uncharacterized protein (TIGR00369 family) [Reinekea marinisedimentorum]
MIWKKSVDLQLINKMNANTAVAQLGIEVTAVTDTSLVARMPVDHRTRQPFGLLHGGASVLLAETAGSIAGNLCVDEHSYCVGLDINANHLAAVKAGWVTATAVPVKLGSRVQVWQIDSVDDSGRAVCAARLTLLVQRQ